MYLFVYVIYIYIDVHTFVSELLGGITILHQRNSQVGGWWKPQVFKAVLKGNPTWPAPYIFDGLK